MFFHSRESGNLYLKFKKYYCFFLNLTPPKESFGPTPLLEGEGRGSCKIIGNLKFIF